MITDVSIVLAKMEDLVKILPIYARARQFMKSHGNPNQWKENKPTVETLEEDIQKRRLYLLKEKDEIHACFVFFIGQEPTYCNIYEGHWLSDSEYGVIHRVASDQSLHGVLTQIVSYCETKIGHLRIDTHADNQIMQHQILKNGFTYCGIIYLEDGDARLAYEKQ